MDGKVKRVHYATATVIIQHVKTVVLVKISEIHTFVTVLPIGKELHVTSLSYKPVVQILVKMEELALIPVIFTLASVEMDSKEFTVKMMSMIVIHILVITGASVLMELTGSFVNAQLVLLDQIVK